MDSVNIKNVRDLKNNTNRDRQRIKGDKVMAKWPLRGRDVAGDLVIYCACTLYSVYCV